MFARGSRRRCVLVRALAAGAAMIAAAACGTTRPAGFLRMAPVARPSIPAPRLQTFVRDLALNRSASLPLDVPGGSGDATFQFALIDRPIPESMLPGALFGVSAATPGRAAVRAVAFTPDEVHLAVYAMDGLHVAVVRGDAPIIYRRISPARDVTGRLCDVTDADDLSPAADDLLVAGVGGRGAAPVSKRLKLVIATSPDLRGSEVNDPETIAEDVADLVHFSNGIFNRDLAVDLALVAPPLDAAPVNLLEADALRTLHDELTRLAKGAGVSMDIGHLFDRGGGGRALIGTVCDSNTKGGAFSRTPDVINPNGFDNFIHEVGHQLGALHSFNAKKDGWQRRGAYEPDVGVTIMGYRDDRLPYFHASSLAFVTAALARAHAATDGKCGTPLPARATPVRVARPVWYVPAMTPFEVSVLPGALDTEYRWDAFDRASKPDSVPPYFASDPERRSARIYPSLRALLSNGDGALHPWPHGRTAQFRVLAFGPGSTPQKEDVSVIVGRGPRFKIRRVACASPCSAGARLQVWWDVARTDQPPYSVETLRAEILDGRSPANVVWHPVPGAEALVNAGGFAEVLIPGSAGEIANARLVLRANDGIFLAISDPFQIAASGPVAGR